VSHPNPRRDEPEENPKRDTREIELDSSGEVKIIPEESLPEPSAPRRIHPRRALPIVPEGPE
jgi:hypothetical protein